MLFGELETAIDVGIDVGFVVPVVDEGGVDLAEAEVLGVEFGGAPAVGEVGGDEFGDFQGDADDLGNVAGVEGDVFVVGGFDREFYHDVTLGCDFYEFSSIAF
jgi:hypothetical protein